MHNILAWPKPIWVEEGAVGQSVLFLKIGLAGYKIDEDTNQNYDWFNFDKMQQMS